MNKVFILTSIIMFNSCVSNSRFEETVQKATNNDMRLREENLQLKAKIENKNAELAKFNDKNNQLTITNRSLTDELSTLKKNQTDNIQLTTDNIQKALQLLSSNIKSIEVPNQQKIQLIQSTRSVLPTEEIFFEISENKVFLKIEPSTIFSGNTAKISSKGKNILNILAQEFNRISTSSLFIFAPGNSSLEATTKAQSIATGLIKEGLSKEKISEIGWSIKAYDNILIGSYLDTIKTEDLKRFENELNQHFNNTKSSTIITSPAPVEHPALITSPAPVEYPALITPPLPAEYPVEPQ